MVKASLQGRGLLQHTPERASFGLPLTFRYRSLGGLDLVSKDGDRHGSLLHLRPALIGDKLYPLYLRLAGDVPGDKPAGRVRGHQGPLEPIKENAMDLFMKQLQGVTRHG
jgi:CRISPR-associated protein Cmr1